MGIAAGSEEINSVFNSILLETTSQASEINFVATDTHRLALYHTPLEVELKSIRLLVPGRIMAEIARLIPAGENNIKLELGENYIYCEVGNVYLFARLITGQFPQYQQVIPQAAVTKVQVRVKDLVEAVERAILITRDEVKARSYIIKIKIDQTLNISAQAAEVGNVEEEVAARIEGPPLELIINGRYLLDVFKVFPGEEAVIEMVNPLKPVLIKPLTRTDYLYLVLPIKTR